MQELIYTKEKIEKLLEKHGYKVIGEIKDIETKIDCIDRDGYKYQITVENMLSGHNPSKIRNNNNFTMENILLFQKKNNTQMRFSEDNIYKNNYEKMKVVCTKCGKEDEKSWVEVQQKDTCSYCCKNPTKVSFETSIAGKRPDLVKFFKDPKDAEAITVMSDKKLKLKCPDCGFEKEMSAGKLTERRFACTKCGDGISIPEKFIGEVLDQLNTNAKREKTFNWSKKFRYDFYLEKENIIIETHGAQHYDEKYSFTKITLSEQQKIDEEKKELALVNGIKEYIEINCSNTDFKKLEKETKKKLGELFELKKINWNKAKQATQNNIMKKICEHWETNKGAQTIEEMAKELDVSRSLMFKYRKLGNELGLCDYIPREIRAKKKNNT